MKYFVNAEDEEVRTTRLVNARIKNDDKKQ